MEIKNFWDYNSIGQGTSAKERSILYPGGILVDNMRKLKEKTRFFFNIKFILLLFLLLAVAGTFSQYLKGPQLFNNVPYTHYNNFIIFKQSFFHLLQGKDLYQLYPSEYWDFYKYSPTFAFFMAPFSIFPDLVGLLLWNIPNCLILFFALRSIAIPDARARSWLLLFVMLELFTSIQNAQSNGLLAGLLIMAFTALEKREVPLAAFLIACSFYLKIFGIAAIILLFLYPDKLKFLLYSAAWIIILGLLPLLIISPEQLLNMYKGWMNLILKDQAVSQGLSVMGIIHSWFSLHIPQAIILAVAAASLLLPLGWRQSYVSEKFRLNYFAALLLWLVIFNHKAESPTYIIAMSGVGLWFFSQKHSPLNLALTLLAFVLSSLSPTDLFPKAIRDSWIIPYQLKALPAVLIWLKIQIDLYNSKSVSDSTVAALPGEERRK